MTPAQLKALRNERFKLGGDKTTLDFKEDLTKKLAAREERAKKFGIVTKEAKNSEKLARAERFGLQTKPGLDEQRAAKLARKEKFGGNAGIAPSENAEDVAKRNERNKRFATANLDDGQHRQVKRIVTQI